MWGGGGGGLIIHCDSTVKQLAGFARVEHLTERAIASTVLIVYTL